MVRAVDSPAFPWARDFGARQLAAFIEDLWGAASGDNNRATLAAIEKAVAAHRPPPAEPSDCPLTARETDVLAQFAGGATYEEAAHNLGVSVYCVNTLARDIYARLDVRSMAQATAIAMHFGWLPNVAFRRPPAPQPKYGTVAWRALYRERIQQMREHPGKPVDIGPYVSISGARKSAWRINKGLIVEAKPAGAFHAEAVRSHDGGWAVRARYVGTPDTEGRAAS